VISCESDDGAYDVAKFLVDAIMGKRGAFM